MIAEAQPETVTRDLTTLRSIRITVIRMINQGTTIRATVGLIGGLTGPWSGRYLTMAMTVATRGIRDPTVAMSAQGIPGAMTGLTMTGPITTGLTMTGPTATGLPVIGIIAIGLAMTGIATTGHGPAHLKIAGIQGLGKPPKADRRKHEHLMPIALIVIGPVMMVPALSAPIREMNAQVIQSQDLLVGARQAL
jgi:type IV secretory pathway VirB2 component (pilin)